jgi:hypothetical protein
MKPEYVAESVEICIARYLADSESRFGWVRAAGRSTAFVPRYLASRARFVHQKATEIPRAGNARETVEES